MGLKPIHTVQNEYRKRPSSEVRRLDDGHCNGDRVASTKSQRRWWHEREQILVQGDAQDGQSGTLDGQPLWCGALLEQKLEIRPMVAFQTCGGDERTSFEVKRSERAGLGRRHALAIFVEANSLANIGAKRSHDNYPHLVYHFFTQQPKILPDHTHLKTDTTQRKQIHSPHSTPHYHPAENGHKRNSLINSKTIS